MIQDAALVDLKKARPWYAAIDSDVLQRNVARLNTAYKRFMTKQGGFPKFKNRSNFRSFEYKPNKDLKGRFLPNGQSAKRGLNRAISDASWGDLLEKIEYAAAKSGKVFMKVDPKHTSQKCSCCGHVDKANRKGEKFICTSCGHFEHADKQAARNIRTRAIDVYQLKVPGDSRKPTGLASQTPMEISARLCGKRALA